MISELISATGLTYGGAKTLELLRFQNHERPIGIQIFGENQHQLCQAAQIVEKHSPDFIDLNVGCPVPKVVKKGGGSALMRDVRSLSNILQALVKSVHIPVSIKIRTGWDASEVNALEVARVAQEAGVAFISIHGRTRAQGYSGLADWDLIGNVKAKIKIPVIGNGDIVSGELAVQRLQDSGVDAVMIGRGALRNPFIFEQALAFWHHQTPFHPSAHNYLTLLNDMKCSFESFFPAHYAFIHAKKFLAWFSSGFSGCHGFRTQVFSCKTATLLWEISHAFFSTLGEKQNNLPENFLMGGHG